MHKLAFEALAWSGWAFCEAAFRTDMGGPFSHLYRLGNWCYGTADRLAGPEGSGFGSWPADTEGA